MTAGYGKAFSPEEIQRSLHCFGCGDGAPMLSIDDLGITFEQQQRLLIWLAAGVLPLWKRKYHQRFDAEKDGGGCRDRAAVEKAAMCIEVAGTPRRRPAHERDHLWLKWNDERGPDGPRTDPGPMEQHDRQMNAKQSLCGSGRKSRAMAAAKAQRDAWPTRSRRP